MKAKEGDIMKKESRSSLKIFRIGFSVIFLILVCLGIIFNFLDEMLAWITFAVFLFFIHFMILLWSPYNPKAKRMKYVSVENKVFAKLLISKRNFYIDGYVKVEDRKKISLLSVILYIWEALLLIATVILQIISPIPCTPYIFQIPSRRGRTTEIVLSSLNIKIPLLLCVITAFSMFGGVLLWITVGLIKLKEKTTKLKWGLLFFILFDILYFAILVSLLLGLLRN